MFHRGLCGALGCAAVIAAAVAPSAGAATVGGCQLAGTAAFSPGLGTTSQPFDYSFGGKLSGCQSSAAGSPTGGTVSAGQTLTEQVTNSVTGSIDTVTYREPTATGAGGCSSSTTSGLALAQWSDGSTTVIKYATTGVAAAVNLTGAVVPSMTVTAVNPAAGDPATLTIATTRYGGDSATGGLAFQPPSPTDCTAASGVTTAGISGVVGLNG